MQVEATLKNLRMSPRKVRLVSDSIVGMDVDAAFVQLDHLVKKGGKIMQKLLSSALANAENNFGLDRDNLYISSILVGDGARLKRWLPRAQGRATQILKRTCHIKLELSEKIEGKNRKSKQELEKEREKRQAEKEKMMKKAVEEMEQAEKEQADAQKAPAKKIEVQKETAKKGQDSGFLKKVFQRKSA